jgi:hypothetical protein
MRVTEAASYFGIRRIGTDFRLVSGIACEGAQGNSLLNRRVARMAPPPDVRETTLEVPADTYAGSAQLTFVVGRLRGAAVKIRFHSFNCIPDPRIIAIKATPLSGLVPWSMYPGKLVKIEMTPDFGWLNIFIAPFIPRIYGWFDPADRFQFVGGQFDRYYKGRHILMERAREAKPAAQRSTSLPSEH